MSDFNDHDHNCDDRCEDDCGRCGEDRASQYRLFISKDTLFFGAETVGTISEDIEVILKNIGWADILLQSLQVTGPYVLDRTKCPDVLKPGREGKLKLNFVPTQWGAQTGSVFIKAGRAGEHYIQMTGAGYTSNENGADLAGLPIFDVLEDNGTPRSLKNVVNLVYDAGSYAIVVADPILENDDIYKKIGASGSGSWQPAGLMAQANAQARADIADISDITNQPADFNGNGLVPTRLNGSVPTLRKLEKNFDDSLDAHETVYETSLHDHETVYEQSLHTHEQTYEQSLATHEQTYTGSLNAHQVSYETQINNAHAVVTNAADAADPNNPAGVPGTVTVGPGVVRDTLAKVLDGVRNNNRFMVATWAILAAITDRTDKAVAEVATSDAGTHTDPGTANVVANSGIFTFVKGTGWRRTADLVAPTVAATIDRTSTNKAASPAGVETQITSHLGDAGAAGQINYRTNLSVQAALDQLLYAGIKITSFTGTPNQIEPGDAPNVTFSWTTSGNITKQLLNNVDVLLGTTSKVINAQSVNYDHVLVVEDSTAPGGKVSATATIQFRVVPKWYAGISATITPADTDLRGLATQGFATTRARSVTFNATGGGYPTYAWPSSLGAVTSVKVGGLTFTDYTVTTRTVVNAFGSNVSMNILVFNKLQNGAAIQVDIA